MQEAGLGSGRGRARALALAVAVLATVGTAAAGRAATPPESSTGVPMPANGDPRIFATGDSMMRYLDGRLGADLAQVQPLSFGSEYRIGSGISKENWVQIARRQVAKYRPRATVVFLGAADGFDLDGARCCRSAWMDAYTKRAQKMISVYSRKGLGEVYWLTLPTPRDARRGRIFRAINRAIRRAVRTSGPHAHVVDVWARLTPGGRYRRTMSYEGRKAVIRTEDGAHLTSGGHAVTTPLIVAALRRDGIIY